MANYEGKFRSNYFGVLDVDAFQAWCRKRGLEMIEGKHLAKDGVRKMGFLMSEDDDTGSVPTHDYTEAEDDFCGGGETEIDFYAELGAHLAPGEVAVVESVGWEKMRYLSAHAVAVNSKGETVELNMDEIYSRAEQQLCTGKIEAATY